MYVESSEKYKVSFYLKAGCAVILRVIRMKDFSRRVFSALENVVP
jgi:hypothetical protein